MSWKESFAEVTLSRSLRVPEEGGPCELGSLTVGLGRSSNHSSLVWLFPFFFSLPLSSTALCSPSEQWRLFLLGRKVKGKIRECLHLTLPWRLAREGATSEGRKGVDGG